ncbi:MAG TPA: hypothetical protein IGQ16_11645 [Thermosynechococcus sp. M3746_W2019_013]|nr:hypothetical protein [Thermosynechococcus sp. M3746_W2019_013]HIK24289.1 hypothetical protein [Thermosynechococcus sp. M3746_W2019_013]
MEKPKPRFLGTYGQFPSRWLPGDATAADRCGSFGHWMGGKIPDRQHP